MNAPPMRSWLKGPLWMLLATLAWSSSEAAAKVASEPIGALLSAGTRFVIGGAALLLVWWMAAPAASKRPVVDSLYPAEALTIGVGRLVRSRLVPPWLAFALGGVAIPFGLTHYAVLAASSASVASILALA